MITHDLDKKNYFSLLSNFQRYLNWSKVRTLQTLTIKRWFFTLFFRNKTWEIPILFISQKPENSTSLRRSICTQFLMLSPTPLLISITFLPPHSCNFVVVWHGLNELHPVKNSFAEVIITTWLIRNLIKLKNL